MRAIIYPILRRWWLLLMWEWLGRPRRVLAKHEAKMRAATVESFPDAVKRRIELRWAQAEERVKLWRVR